METPPLLQQLDPRGPGWETAVEEFHAAYARCTAQEIPHDTAAAVALHAVLWQTILQVQPEEFRRIVEEFRSCVVTEYDDYEKLAEQDQERFLQAGGWDSINLEGCMSSPDDRMPRSTGSAARDVSAHGW